MPDPSRPPEWMVRDLMARYSAFHEPPPDPTPTVTEVESLAALGYDGSRLRRRYWKKVRFT